MVIIITTRDSRSGNDIEHIGGKIQENEKKRVSTSKYKRTCYEARYYFLVRKMIMAWLVLIIYCEIN